MLLCESINFAGVGTLILVYDLGRLVRRSNLFLTAQTHIRIWKDENKMLECDALQFSFDLLAHFHTFQNSRARHRMSRASRSVCACALTLNIQPVIFSYYYWYYKYNYNNYYYSYYYIYNYDYYCHISTGVHRPESSPKAHANQLGQFC